MKKVLLMIIILLISKNLFSQDFEPSQHKFYFQGDSVLLNAEMDYFKQDRFILGWHWGIGKRMSEALGCTQGHTNEQKKP